jgi:hypothetical protein
VKEGIWDMAYNMADTRMSSFLPTIKCSMCAREIEISMMGDHVCAPAAERELELLLAIPYQCILIISSLSSAGLTRELREPLQAETNEWFPFIKAGKATSTSSKHINCEYVTHSRL